MRDAREVLGPIVVFSAIAMGGLFGFIIGDKYWSCSNYDGQTKMVAGICYIQAAPDKWVTLSSYIKCNKPTVTGEE